MWLACHVASPSHVNVNFLPSRCRHVFLSLLGTEAYTPCGVGSPLSLTICAAASVGGNQCARARAASFQPETFYYTSHQTISGLISGLLHRRANVISPGRRPGKGGVSAVVSTYCTHPSIRSVSVIDGEPPTNQLLISSSINHHKFGFILASSGPSSKRNSGLALLCLTKVAASLSYGGVSN